ncbi:MAG: DUF2267 domain-containing protein [Yoonia sp.]|nr:DUF2267 domain-containing protein [Yoonia sp.]
MSSQGLESIDHSVHLTHEWINELVGRLDWSSHRSAWRLMRVVMTRIRDHLPTNETAQLSAQLPMLIRGSYFEGWMPKVTPIKERSAASFIGAIDAQMGDASEYRGADDIICVFDLLNNRITRGEVLDIQACLPEDIRALWPQP